jgi:hypothetical protein
MNSIGFQHDDTRHSSFVTGVCHHQVQIVLRRVQLGHSICWDS